MKHCPFCKAEIEENARFCLYCMTPLEDKEAIPAVPQRRKGWPIWLALLLCALVVVAVMLFLSDEPISSTGGTVSRATATTALPSTEKTTGSLTQDSTTTTGSSSTFAGVIPSDGETTIVDTTTQSGITPEHTTTTTSGTVPTSSVTTTVPTVATSTTGTVSSESETTTTTTTTSTKIASTTTSKHPVVTATKTTTTVPTVTTTNKKTGSTKTSTTMATTTSKGTTTKVTTTTVSKVTTTTTTTVSKVTTTEKTDTVPTGTTMTTSSSVTTTTSATVPTEKPVSVATYTYRDVTAEDDVVMSALSFPTDAIVITGVITPSSDGVYIVPSEIDGRRVLAIMPEAFCGDTVAATVKTVVLPSQIKDVWDAAFAKCYYLTDIYFGSGTIHVAETAFAPVEKREGALTIHCSADCKNAEYYYYRNIADNVFGAQYEEWDGITYE